MHGVAIRHKGGLEEEQTTRLWFLEMIPNHVGNPMAGAIEPDSLSKVLCSDLKAAGWEGS